MKISAKGQYAVRLMVDLAKAKQSVSLLSIAKNQEISTKYLEQIASKLVKSGLIEATRGALGGYSLCKSANQISIKDILETTGDTCQIAPCVNGVCARKGSCHASKVWGNLGKLIDDYLAKITLSDLIK
ncbi:MAG: Rrf2 family transcriptional regulator [Clostridia bacterium]|nr:Rrf2 family transcriptional regulator [Clostridia bacterium]